MHLARGAARHREVLAGKMDKAAIDGCATGHHAVGGQFLLCHAEVGRAMLREEADLLEAVAVHELFHALARRQLARGMLLLDALPRRPRA